MPRLNKELTQGERQAAFILLSRDVDPASKTGLKWGVLSRVAKSFDVDRHTMSRLWRETRDRLIRENKTIEEAAQDHEFFQTKKGNRGRKETYDRKLLRGIVRGIPKKSRRNFRTLAVATGVPRSTLHRMMHKERVFKRHSSPLKPILSEENKVTRVLYCIDEVFPVPDYLGKYYYKNLFDRVDIDEKWFNLSSNKENYIVLDPSYNDSDDDNEDEMPHCRVRNKGYKNKVLFLCAQARPRWDPHRNAYWDGKLGIWPVGSWKPAQRTSIQRAAGTMVWYNETVTRDVYRRLLVQKLLPAIETLWPRGEWANPSVVIRVQQDGPQSHIKPNDTKWNEELQRRGLQNKILVFTQPPNSPDLNINDLGYFRALQSSYRQFSPSNEAEIINYVEQTYAEYPPVKINRIYLSLMGVMNEIIDRDGNNDFEPPHLKKEQNERMNQLPVCLEVTNKALEYLEAN